MWPAGSRFVVLIGLLAVAGCQTPESPPARPGQPGGTVAPANRAPGLGSVRPPVPPEVRLDEVVPAHPGPVETGRNPFRFGSRLPVTPSGPGPVTPGPGPVDRDPESLAGGPSPDTVDTVTPSEANQLKFIGIVEALDSVGTVAVLSDGRSVYHGRQGDIIEGRYRIVRIGVESIEIEVLDGGHRRTLRLSGL